MAADGSWPSIKRHGLLSTSALLDLFEVTPGERDDLEARRRPESVRLQHPIHGQAWVRDQKPMTDSGLVAALAGTELSPEDWYRFLNRHVFFWLTEGRLFTMLGARPYRNEAHTVLVLDTRGLAEEHLAQVTLSSMNSGATRPFPWPRDFRTFRPLDKYPFAALRHKRRPQDVVVELAVDYSVANVRDYVLEVRRMRGTAVLGFIATD
jgi:Family of unknown function (DUF7002)